jgi:ComF family protein
MGVLDLLFPKSCLGCKRNDRYVCDGCIRKVRKIRQTCTYCEKSSIDGLTHVKCKRKFGLDGLVSVWKYQKVVRKAILGLKYKFATDVTKELVNHLENFLKENGYGFTSDWVLIPIPLHRLRKNWRGFNQVEEIGKLLSEKMKWNYNDDLLIRSEKRIPQTDLKGEQRKLNVQGVFSLNSNYSLLTTHNSLLIFDDVYTTGSTIKEAAKVLKKAGAKKVWGLTITK